MSWDLLCVCLSGNISCPSPGSTAELRYHLPYGTPRVLMKNADYCLLRHTDYINSYSKDLRMPLWVAYTIQPLVGPAYGEPFMFKYRLVQLKSSRLCFFRG